MNFTQFRDARISELLQERYGDLRVPDLLSLIDVAKPKRVLEIGAYEGVSTEVFLLHAGHVTTVDPWPGWMQDIHRAFQARAGCYPHCRAIRGISPENVPDERFDLCYIDGDHSYEAVLRDIAVCMNRTTKWIGGHDYNGPDTPDVAVAVSHAFPGIRPTVFSNSSWLIQVGPFESAP